MVAEVNSVPYSGQDTRWAAAVAARIKLDEDTIKLLQQQIAQLVKKVNGNY